MPELLAFGVFSENNSLQFVRAGPNVQYEDAEAYLASALDGAIVAAEEQPARCEIGRIECELDCAASAFALATPARRMLLLVARHVSDGNALECLRAVHTASTHAAASPFFLSSSASFACSSQFNSAVTDALSKLH